MIDRPLLPADVVQKKEYPFAFERRIERPLHPDIAQMQEDLRRAGIQTLERETFRLDGKLLDIFQTDRFLEMLSGFGGNATWEKLQASFLKQFPVIKSSFDAVLFRLIKVGLISWLESEEDRNLPPRKSSIALTPRGELYARTGKCEHDELIHDHKKFTGVMGGILLRLQSKDETGDSVASLQQSMYWLLEQTYSEPGYKLEQGRVNYLFGEELRSLEELGFIKSSNRFYTGTVFITPKGRQFITGQVDESAE